MIKIDILDFYYNLFVVGIFMPLIVFVIVFILFYLNMVSLEDIKFLKIMTDRISPPLWALFKICLGLIMIDIECKFLYKTYKNYKRVEKDKRRDK